MVGFTLILLGINDTSTLLGHFVSCPREREKNREEKGAGMKVKKQKQ